MRNKWLVLILLVSIGLNLAFAGFIIGRGVNHAQGWRIDPTRGYPRWARALPQERLEALRPLLVSQWRKARPHLRDMRQKHQAVRQALTAQPFDPEQLENSLVSLGSAGEQSRSRNRAAFINFVEALTDEERKQLAQHLGRRPKPDKTNRHPGPSGEAPW